MKVAKIYPDGFNECDVRWVSLPKIDPKILKKIGEMIEDREL